MVGGGLLRRCHPLWLISRRKRGWLLHERPQRRITTLAGDFVNITRESGDEQTSIQMNTSRAQSRKANFDTSAMSIPSRALASAS